MAPVSPTNPEWPPLHRCENCQHWKRPWLYRLFSVGMGDCRLRRFRTWRSYTCREHVPLNAPPSTRNTR
jgi:hypothetical protein